MQAYATCSESVDDCHICARVLSHRMGCLLVLIRGNLVRIERCLAAEHVKVMLHFRVPIQ
jgi:hypothetical protein